MTNSSRQDSDAPRGSPGLLVTLVALGISAIIFAFTAKVMEVPSRYRMAKEGITAPGWITAKEPQNRGGLVVYAYKVEGKTYSDKGGLGNDFEMAKVGDPITVTYDPMKPSISTVSDAERDFWQLLIMAIVFSVISGVVVAVSLRLGGRMVRQLLTRD